MRNLVLGLFLAAAIAAPASAQTAPAACNHERSATASPQLLAARRAMKNACAVDRANFCQSVADSCGGPMRCLLPHAGQLSPDCAGAMRNVQALRASGQ